MNLIYKLFYSLYKYYRRYSSKEVAYNQAILVLFVTFVFGVLFVYQLIGVLFFSFFGWTYYCPNKQFNKGKIFIYVCLLLYIGYKLIDMLLRRYYLFDRDLERSINFDVAFSRRDVFIIFLFLTIFFLGNIIVAGLYHNMLNRLH